MSARSRPISIILIAALAACALLFAADASQTNAQARFDVNGKAAATLARSEESVAAKRAGAKSNEAAAKRHRDSLAEVHRKKHKKGLPSEPCARNVKIAASRGLKLPSGWEFHCVGPGLDWNGASHWGVTCPYAECPEGKGPYVSVSKPNYYVISHELCHANFGNDELMADRCAAKHGASLATSPYQ